MVCLNNELRHFEATPTYPNPSLTTVPNPRLLWYGTQTLSGILHHVVELVPKFEISHFHLHLTSNASVEPTPVDSNYSGHMFKISIKTLIFIFGIDLERIFGESRKGFHRQARVHSRKFLALHTYHDYLPRPGGVFPAANRKGCSARAMKGNLRRPISGKRISAESFKGWLVAPLPNALRSLFLSRWLTRMRPLCLSGPRRNRAL